jgi:hypothetical protein
MGWVLMGSCLRLGLLTAAGLVLLALPAAAQFGNNPPRPPGAVPNRGPAPPPVAPGPPPLNMQDAMPPEEMDDDAAPPQPPARAIPQTAIRGAPPPAQQMPSVAPGSIRSVPLAPPAGSVANAPGTGPSIPPVGEPGAPGAGQMKPPPPSTTAPQPGDEVVMEMPAVKIQNPTAVFAGLDKITGRIIAFDVKLNETMQFGALKVTPRICYTRPTTETAHTDGFVDVDEVTLQGETKRIFTGWMFAGSPGLHAVEHPIYDIWLTNCKGGATVVADTQPAAPRPTQSGPAGSPRPQGQQQRSGAAPAGTPPAGATAATTQPRPQRQPAPQQAPDALQPLPPPPGSVPVQWPPRR